MGKKNARRGAKAISHVWLKGNDAPAKGIRDKQTGKKGRHQIKQVHAQNDENHPRRNDAKRRGGEGGGGGRRGRVSARHQGKAEKGRLTRAPTHKPVFKTRFLSAPAVGAKSADMAI